ncbi:FHA domain-containing protein [Salinibacterium sp. M195]|uniref:FHA domain-containing protein n=1 Tax=Salinibacterium sp. M195 TaxID=2583374 RepID=UPI0021048621|nr:FHA domain-containing protein [Salinibacterium sp. M195]QYH35701.1 FHA domain-containing protein [Salinibacterium sp. M195]
MTYLYAPPVDTAWSAVVGEQQIILVDSLDVSLLDTLWAKRSLGVQAAVETLSARGLSATPAFAIVEWTADDDNRPGARVIVRGPVSITLGTPAGTETVSGVRVSTWAERYCDDVVDCVVIVDNATTADQLPIVEGVVRAAQLSCSQVAAASTPIAAVASVSASAPTAAPVPAAVPEPAPVPVSAPAAEPSAPFSEVTIVDRPADIDDESIQDVASSIEVEDNSSGYDYLFGETVVRDISTAAAGQDVGDDESLAGQENATSVVEDLIGKVPTSASASDAAAAVDPEGDHDGMTIMTSDLADLRAARSKERTEAPPAPEQQKLYLQMSTGARESLTQPILIGRAPTVSKVSSGALPRLVTIPGDKDISRNHVQIVVEGGTAVVTDLHSRNGTHVALPGRPSQRLRAGEPTTIIVGTVIDLGGEVTLTVGEDA